MTGRAEMHVAGRGALGLDGVSKVYRTLRGEPIVAVRDVELEISAAEFVAVLGPSGCGKSTILAMIAGLLEPSRGTVTMDGEPIEGPSPDRGVVFQNSSVFPWLKVLDNVMFGLNLLRKDLTKAARLERARDHLALVGLERFETNYPKELSGGMRQRLAIAQTLACDPKVLLMDEPFGALDAFTRDTLQGVLLKIWEADRKTVVFVTHSVDEAVFLADRIVVMRTQPGHVAAVLTNSLPRPRSIEVRKSPEFGTFRTQAWDLIGGVS